MVRLAVVRHPNAEALQEGEEIVGVAPRIAIGGDALVDLEDVRSGPSGSGLGVLQDALGQRLEHGRRSGPAGECDGKGRAGGVGGTFDPVGDLVGARPSGGGRRGVDVEVAARSTWRCGSEGHGLAVHEAGGKRAFSLVGPGKQEKVGECTSPDVRRCGARW